MKTIASFFVLLTALISNAAAVPYHSIVAYSETTETKLSILLPVDLGQPGTFIISKMNDEARDEVLNSAEFQNVPVNADINANHSFPTNIITLDLGRTGKIEISFKSEGTCELTSTMREFWFPQPTRFDICSYFYVVGPRPGMSGSN